MIKSIYIKNYAIIAELRLDFHAGLQIFTGETGAGKSIIIGAIGFIKGARADTSFIRQGADKATVEAIFDLDERMQALLKENDIEDEDEVIIYRTLDRHGKSRIRVNNCTVTLAFLQQLLLNEIDIHSQKDSQYLLKSDNHLTLLDTFLNDQALLNEVKAKYSAYQKSEKEYNSFLKAEISADDLDYYNYQIKEIDAFNPDVAEEKELNAKALAYKNAAKNIAGLNSLLNLYEKEGGLAELIYAISHNYELESELYAKIKETFTDIYFSLEDAFAELRKLRDEFDLADSEINTIEERLYNIARLKRKYHRDLAGIIAYKKELEDKVKAFNERQKKIDEYQSALKVQYQVYKTAADKLSLKRAKAAAELKKAVEAEVASLELKYFAFKAELKKGDDSVNGYDRCNFLITTNRGEDYKALNKVASGGEMSRLLLGLKVIFTRLMRISLVIFDEIDTGVSGKAASAMGLKMAKIAKYATVLAITHLPQVAAFADVHYRVLKDLDRDKRTVSSLLLLDDKQRREELALLTGGTVSENALKMADELIERAQQLKAER